MSVRLCYVERANRGATVRQARLIGQGVDDRWSDPAPEGAPEQGVDAFEVGSLSIRACAAWAAQSLAPTRAAGRIEMLCLDDRGSVCSWVSTPSLEPGAVASIARLGTSAPVDDAVGAGQGAVLTYFAGDPLDSTVQPLAGGEPLESPGENGERGSLWSRWRAGGRRGAGAATVERIAVMAGVDAPARLLLDALDDQGVEVGQVASVWHALAQAWDPGSPLNAGAARDGADVAEDTPSTAVVVLAAGAPGEASRLLWAWSRAGRVLAAGSLRVARRADGSTPLVGPTGGGIVSRLAADWMAWSLQIGEAPRRVVGVVSDASAGQFGTELAQAWNGATVDLALDDDPLGATFARLAAALEGTPATARPELDAARTLLDLSTRPGRAHRRLYGWATALVFAASAVTGVIAWQIGGSAAHTKAAAAKYRQGWAGKVDMVVPGAMTRPLGPKATLQDEVAKRRRDILPPVEAAMPILDELETISMVLQGADATLESLELNTGDVVRMTVQGKDVATVEGLERALNAIAGSHAAYRAQIERREGQGGLRARITGTWAPSGGQR